MTLDFTFRMIGMVLFAFLGAKFGAASASGFNLNPETSIALFSMVGSLLGLILSPWVSLRPLRVLRESIDKCSDERLLMSALGLSIALSFALVIAYPLSRLESPVSSYLALGLAIVASYLGISVFGSRSKNLTEGFGAYRSKQINLAIDTRELIVDTSVLIDGRIVEIAKTGVLGGNLIVPRFILNELYRVAASPELLIRRRGERGLEMLEKLQQNKLISMKIVDEDFDDIRLVDDKLVALAQHHKAPLITNDFNLNQVASSQGVGVLNINRLANAVRLVYIPGETFEVSILQEGRDKGQGLAYLKDGTLVIVKNGKHYINKTIKVEVTNFITKDTGHIIFAIPETEQTLPS